MTLLTGGDRNYCLGMKLCNGIHNGKHLLWRVESKAMLKKLQHLGAAELIRKGVEEGRKKGKTVYGNTMLNNQGPISRKRVMRGKTPPKKQPPSTSTSSGVVGGRKSTTSAIMAALASINKDKH